MTANQTHLLRTFSARLLPSLALALAAAALVRPARHETIKTDSELG